VNARMGSRVQYNTAARPVVGADMSDNGMGYTNSLRPIILSKIGAQTADGSRYAMRSLHPMDEDLAGGTRLPDATSDQTAALECRYTDVIGAPAGLAAGATWDMDILVLNIPDVAYLYRVYPSATPPTSPSYQPVYFPVFGDQPITQDPNLSKWSAAYRGVFKGLTTHLVASALNDSGLVYGAQWASKPDHSAVSPNAGAVIQYLEYSQTPATPQELEAQVPGTVMFNARHGMYTPFKYIDPVHLYTSSETNNLNNAASKHGHVVMITDTYGEQELTTHRCSDVVNFTVGMQMYRGLASNASVHVHIREGLEVIPSTTSPWTAFTETSAYYEPRVMEKVVQVQQQLALSFPANYNDLSGILGAISKVVNFMSPVTGAIKKWGVPYVSNIAEAGNDFTTGVSGWLDKLARTVAY